MKTLKQIKKIVIAVVGFTILLISLVLILLPGTVMIVALGLTILASEFVWAEKWLLKVKDKIVLTTNGFKKKNNN